MRRRGLLIQLLFLAVAASGCGENDGGGTTGPPDFAVGPVTQAFLEGLVQNLAYDAQWVFTRSYDDSRGFAYSLIGVDEGYVGAVTLVPNLPPGEYQPFCSFADDENSGPPPPFWETRDRCTRLRVEAAGITVFDVYMTMRPHTLPDDRHAFDYEVAEPPGTITYDPNPLLSWRADVRDPENVVVSVELDLRPAFRDDDGAFIPLAHTGSVNAVGPALGNPTHTIQLAFSELIGDESPLLIGLTIEPEAPFRADGTVVVEDETLATIGGTGDALSFQWR